jgi:hypothetical protein
MPEEPAQPQAVPGQPQATQPFQAPAVAAPTAAAAKTTQNISSNELERDEVHEIAAELREELDSPKPADNMPVETAKKTEHLIDLQSSQSEGDTIFIDRDGSFRQADKPAGKQEQPSS